MTDLSAQGSRDAGSGSGDRPRSHTRGSEAELQIFEATERLLAITSLHDITVAAIIEVAGVSRGTFYHYFSSKYAVATGLLERVMDEIFETVTPFIDRDPADSPALALRESLEAATSVWGEHRLILRAVHEHWHSVPELRTLWLAIFDRFTGALAEQFDRERAAGLLSAQGDGETTAAMLLWATEGCLYVAGLGADPRFGDERSMVEPIVELWVGTLFGGTARAVG